jgi:molybdopterin molybdotransferase
MQLDETGADQNSARRFGRNAVTVENARRRVLSCAAPTGYETIPLSACFGRYAAEAIAASDPVPHFRRSGMDGYAVIASDTAGAGTDRPVTFRVIGSIAAGEVPTEPVTSGTAMRIMTGAMLPEGADAVIMLEMTAVETTGTVPAMTVKRSISPGANVSGIGSDVAAGTSVVERGSRLGPAEIALLATIGVPQVPVFRKPSVALLSTGTELLSPSAPLEPGKIRNSNVYMLAAQVISAGAEPVLFDSVPDRKDDIARAVVQNLQQHDLVITTGGVSVGDYDMMAELLQDWDGELLFNKVQMRPGSVTSAAVRGGKLLLALSGNPGACFAGFELFGRPALTAMQGSQALEPVLLSAMLAEPFPKVNAYPRYLRGRCWTEGGRLMASARAGDQSSRLLPGLGADCFVIIPPGGDGLAAGDAVSVLLFDGRPAG